MELYEIALSGAMIAISGGAIGIFVKNKMNLQRKCMGIMSGGDMSTPKEPYDIKEDFQSEIDEFIDTLWLDGDSGFDENNFRINLNSCTLVVTPRKEQAYAYNRSKNVIEVDPEDKRVSVLQGLLEISSKFEWEEYGHGTIEAYGLERNAYFKDETRLYGKGLNEGYKDILMFRYFNIPPRYPECSQLAGLLELLLGQKLMKRAYFNGDLGWLNDEFFLKTGKNLLPILREFDKLFYYSDGYGGLLSAKKAYREIFVTLAKLIIDDMQKNYSMYSEDPLTRGEYESIHAKRALIGIRRILIGSRGKDFLDIRIPKRYEKEIKDYGDKVLCNLPTNYRVFRPKKK